MRLFAVQALVDERSLWEVMKYLEGTRAQGILARPYYPPEEEQLTTPSLPPPRGRRANGRGDCRAAILAVIANNGSEPISTASVQAVAGNEALAIKLLSQNLRALAKEGILRRVGYGQYVATKKKASPLNGGRAPQHMSKAARIRAAALAALASREKITSKEIHQSTGIPSMNVDSALHSMVKAGTIKRIAAGVYVKGKKSEAAS